jgi:hypothetical protein
MKDMLDWISNNGCLTIVILLILCSWTPIAIYRRRAKCKRPCCKDAEE